eukprot:992363-Amphidinium_carterae.3
MTGRENYNLTCESDRTACRSATGTLQWLSIVSWLDVSSWCSLLQKSVPTLPDPRDLYDAIQHTRETAKEGITIILFPLSLSCIVIHLSRMLGKAVLKEGCLLHCARGKFYKDRQLWVAMSSGRVSSLNVYAALRWQLQKQWLLRQQKKPTLTTQRTSCPWSCLTNLCVITSVVFRSCDLFKSFIVSLCMMLSCSPFRVWKRSAQFYNHKDHPHVPARMYWVPSVPVESRCWERKTGECRFLVLLLHDLPNSISELRSMLLRKKFDC